VENDCTSTRANRTAEHSRAGGQRTPIGKQAQALKDEGKAERLVLDVLVSVAGGEVAGSVDPEQHGAAPRNIHMILPRGGIHEHAAGLSLHITTIIITNITTAVIVITS
jgi:hypothetical protein